MNRITQHLDPHLDDYSDARQRAAIDRMLADMAHAPALAADVGLRLVSIDPAHGVADPDAEAHVTWAMNNGDGCDAAA